LTLDGHARDDVPAQTLVPTLTRRDLLHDRQFVTFSAAFAVGLFAQIGLVSHLVARLAPEVGQGLASAALSLITVSAIVGRTLLGWILGDHNRRLVASANFLIQAIGIALLAVGGGVGQLVLGCIIFGLTGGNHLTLPPLIAQEEFKPADVATVVALAVATSQGAMAFGPAVFGMLHDATASYAVPFGLAAVAQVAAGTILLAGRGNSRERQPTP
jgi:predicted MFS family arabinose efflux permease